MLETRRVTTDFGAVRIATLNDGDERPPLVFVHGYPDNLQIWSRVFNALNVSDRRLIGFDWPGLGHSEPYTGGATPFHLGRHFVAVLDALGVDRAIPVGFDMGAHAVVAAAAKNPERIDRLVLTNFLADGDVETSWDIDVMRKLGLNRMILKWAPRVVFERAQRTFLDEGALTSSVKDDLWSGFGRTESLTHLRRMCAGYQASLPRVTRQFSEIAAETLVVWADDDPHFPLAQGHAVVDGISRSELKVLTGGSHWFMWERADEFSRILLDFLDVADGSD